MIGIDVSKHQGAINWPKVKAAGIEFAFIRVGWAGYEGGIDEGYDTYFTANMQGAIAAGIPVGVYVYSYCKTPEAARLAAQQALALCAPYRLGMPIAFDMEVDSSTVYQKLTKAENTAICKAFLETVEAAGEYAMLYTYKDFAQNRLDMPQLAAYDFWLAHYTAKSDYPGAYGIHQYSSSGSVDGIPGRVDMNIAYKDYPALIAGMGAQPLSGEPVRMVCTATGADEKHLCDMLDSMGIAYELDGDRVITGYASAGDQTKLVAAARAKGIVWDIYTAPIEDDGKTDSGLLTDEPEDETVALKKEVESLWISIDLLRHDNDVLHSKMNILLRRANIEEV